jgi:hypothetical protein
VGPEYRVRITEDGVRGTEERQCKGANRSGAPVERWGTKTGRGVASPRPPCVGVQGEALPLPAGGARERRLGWHAVPTLPEAGERTLLGERTRRSRAPTRGRSPRKEVARLVRSPNPTRYNVKGGTGDRNIGRRLESSLNYLSAKH